MVVCNSSYFCPRDRKCIPLTLYRSQGNVLKRSTLGYLPSITTCTFQPLIDFDTVDAESGDYIITEFGVKFILEDE